MPEQTSFRMKQTPHPPTYGIRQAVLSANKYCDDENSNFQDHQVPPVPRTIVFASLFAAYCFFCPCTDRCVRRASTDSLLKLARCPDQKLDHPDTWTASNLVALGRTHRLLLQGFNCVESAHGLLPTLQLEMMLMSVTATARGPQPTFLFRDLTNLLHSMPRKVNAQSCRTSVVSPLRSCANGCSIPPSRTSPPLLEVRNWNACTGSSPSTPSPTQRRATWAIQSCRRTCLMTRTITVSPTRGESSLFTVGVALGLPSTSIAHGRWRKASLHGRRSSAST